PESVGNADPGSGTVGTNGMSAGAGCKGAAAATPPPKPDPHSANPAHTAAQTSRPPFETADIVYSCHVVERSLATHITWVTIVANSHSRNTTRSRFALYESADRFLAAAASRYEPCPIYVPAHSAI